MGNRVWNDSDGDGVQDFNEIGIAGVTLNLYSDPDGDADGDGFSNFEEYLAGTDPLDANSLLKISGLDISNAGRVVVRWQSTSNMLYSVEHSTNISGNWLPVANGIRATPPMNVNTVLIDSAGVPQMFFRVIVK